MKRMLWVLALCSGLFLAQHASAQVFADFEQGMDGFWYGWGNAGSNLRQMSDATYGGVLALDISVTATDGDNAKAAIGGPDPLPLKWTESKVGAYFLTFDVFVPADFPDNAQVKLWCQDKVNWTWNDIKYSSRSDLGRPLVKDAWNTLWFPIKRVNELNPNFLPHNAKGGIEFWFGEAGWSGTVMVDNATLWGVEPKVVADFEADNGGFWYGWGNAGSNLMQTTDATWGGVLSLDINVTGTEGDDPKAAIGGPDPLPLEWTDDMEGAAFFSMKVFVPEDFPDSAQVKIWCQDKVNWTWNDVKYSSLSSWGWPLRKGEWNTLAFPVKHSKQRNANFMPQNAKGGAEFWFGVAGWSGTVLIDDFLVHTKEVGKKWVVADFEKESNGTAGFANTGWNQAMTDIKWAVDPTGRSAGVLQTDWQAALDASYKAQFVNGNIDLKWTETDTGATKISIDFWLPADVPAGTQIGFWATDKKSWSWTETKVFVSDTSVNLGGWNTLEYNVLDYQGTLDPVGVIRGGVQVIFPDDSWSGTIYFDNFTLYGVEKPAGALQAPNAAAELVVGNNGVEHAQVTWVDNEDNLNETYNVYMSHSPITDVTAEGVVQIASKIPRGVQFWNHRPYSASGESQTFYYAVTAVSSDGEEVAPGDNSAVGPLDITTSVPAKAIYDPNFVFMIDGTLNEFAPYTDYTVVPEGAGVDVAGDWTPESLDLNYTANFVIDDDYLYIGVNVIDNELATEGQAWEGDAWEMFIGFYDIADQTKWHTIGDIGVAGTGDYRISFTSWGKTQAGGSSDKEYPGMEYLILPGPTGYLIEAKIALDSLAGSTGLMPELGDMLPLRIDCNDKDLLEDGTDSGRSKQLNWGGTGNTENWKRPSSWGYLMVSSTTGVTEKEVAIPLKTDLYVNYPNPFNPTTNLKYSLAKDADVSLIVYNMLGQEIKTLVKEKQAAGYHTIQWDGTDEAGQQVTSGIYFYTFKADGMIKTQKMILMK